MRLIDADALKLAIERYLKKILSHKFLPIVKNAVREVGNDMIFAIDVQQTVDAAPVKHGHWKGYRFPKYRGNDDFGEPIFKEYVAYTCSNCRKQNAIRHKYCPMCGAIMDEVTG